MKNKLLLSVSLIVLAGCSLVPDYTPPQIETPTQWSVPQNTNSALMAKDWWTSFGSDELNTLMAQALQNNNDLRGGIQRVEQSRAQLKIIGASLLPSIDADASASRARNNPDSGRTTTRTNLSAGAGISYELDLFGANRANVEGARFNLAATQYGEDALQLVVMGDVAQTYFNVLNQRERLRIADKNLDNAREVMRIVQARVDAGTESAIELAQQKTVVASNEAARASVDQQISVSENALAVLLGRPPQSIKVEGKNLDNLNVPDVQAGQPSTLLMRRPDIRAAETDLMAANADIGAARAAFFPMVNLGLDWSVAASGFGDPIGTGLSLLSSLSAPIFEGGRLEGGVEQATAREQELVETYHKTILVSFQEVEDALAGVKAAQLRENAFNTARENAQKAYDLSKNLYDAGEIDFQTLLDSQNSLLSSEDSYAQSKLERLNAAVDLYKAVGGGWSS